MTEKQISKRFLDVIEKQIGIFESENSIELRNKIPENGVFPIENQNHWLRIPDVICVFVDMIGSTQFSAKKHDKTTASVYQLFTGTAVRLFHEFEASYIDVRGDGVFALFNSNRPYRALAAAVTFKTFVENEFTRRVKSKTDIVVGGHIGIDQRTVLVRTMGLKSYSDRTDRKNEVWAGKPINMAAKLASETDRGELLVSDRFYNQLKDEHVTMSCGCPNQQKVKLWDEIDLKNDDRFDFDSAYLLKSNWCETHGAEFCYKILQLDKD